jgi:hypothetical protein
MGCHDGDIGILAEIVTETKMLLFGFFFGAMAVQRVSYCTVKNPQNPVATIEHLLYNHAHSDWMKPDKVDFTLPFNERVDGSNPSSLKMSHF